MLVSHSKKFIFLKTIKTGGTSVEIFLEPFCRPPGSLVEHHGPAQVSEAGIVGARGPDATSQQWYNHMPASRLRELLPPDVWAGYHKFTIVRNPFDRLVSFWWMQVQRTAPEAHQRAATDMEFARAQFSGWIVRTSKLPSDRKIYTIDGLPVTDRMLRYERLNDDLTTLCADLNLDADIASLGRYKSEFRQRTEPFQAYYSPEARARVQTDQAAELADNQYAFD